MLFSLVANGIILSTLMAISFQGAAQTQTSVDQNSFSRKNTFGLFAAYSNDSSHILMGDAENRKLLDFGLVYNRRLLQNHTVNWQYSGELLPVALESDPLAQIVDFQTVPTKQTFVYPYQYAVLNCVPVSTPYSITNPNTGITYSGTAVQSCVSRQWTIGEGISPIGFQWNFLPQHKTQFFLDGHGGYMYSTHPIPISTAGSFNFTFDFGAGVEFYRSKKRSLRAEVRFHHISDHGTTIENPGIDNALFQLTYAFGK
jgi:opacity protein-like surface antigen